MHWPAKPYSVQHGLEATNAWQEVGANFVLELREEKLRLLVRRQTGERNERPLQLLDDGHLSRLWAYAQDIHNQLVKGGFHERPHPDRGEREEIRESSRQLLFGEVLVLLGFLEAFLVHFRSDKPAGNSRVLIKQS